MPGYRGRAVVKRLLLASPRGYCAGVERAVETVERALALYGRPVYVRKQIVHNSHVVRDLRARGAVFVDALGDVPEGATVVFSAHGIAPAVRREAGQRELTTIDATCPLVTKVHAQARRYAEAGYTIVLIGHAGHEEVEGTLGEAPDAIVLVQSTADAEQVSLPGDRPLAYVTQTTLSVDETGEIVAVLRRRFPRIEGPAREDICYATSNRQWAVKELLREVDVLLVVGSANSSNSQRLVDVARAEGTSAHLVDDVHAIEESWLAGCETVGLTSGASAPERLVAEICAWFAGRGAEVREQKPVHEDVTFKLPVELRRAERTAA
jgi:4-hydroxy-3-methylbut-2-en-1-yl diphosphate reductase